MDFSCPTVILLSILSHFFVLEITALKCYVCGIDGEESCDNFTVTETKFIKVCGAEEKSCRFARKVTKNVFVSRSCASAYLSDCKEANSIEFCYCTQDLCNFLTPFGDNEEGDGPEEIFEGSGLDTTSKPTSYNNVTTIENLVPKSNLCSICKFSDLLLLTVLLLYLFIP